MRFFDATIPEVSPAISVPTRSQIAESDTWDLTRLYPSDAAWEEAFAEYERLYPSLAGFKGRLGESPEALKEALEFDRKLDLLVERLAHYAGLRTSEDGSDHAHLAREARLQSVMTRAMEVASYFRPELMAISDETFASMLQSNALAEWRNALRKIRRHKPHTLSQPEERLLALSAEPLAGHSESFSQLTNVDLKFGSLKDEEGRERELSQSSFSSFLVGRDADVRKNAFHQFYQQFNGHAFTLASMLAHSVKSDVFEARARNHASAIESALFRDDVPLTVYDNLITAVRANLAPLHDYYELRRSRLGLAEIHHYDTYVPIVASVKTDYDFDQAIGLVLDSLQPLGTEYCEVLGEGMSRGRWCDRFESKGKRSGAFSSSSYGNPPFILMNYKRDVFAEVYTLAHEAGHSMHTWFSQKQQPFQDYHYTIFVAEVASTFNEELLTHHLLEQAREKGDKPMQAYILNRQIDDIRSTLYRQTMFAEFEKKIHAMQEAGEGLTLQSFRTVYRELLETYFGPKFVIDSELELECLRIPHFYSAFYVYKYATGISAALSLSDQVLREGGGAAREAYLKFLGLGGSLMPLEALRVAGIDMASPKPVEAALALFAQRVKELESLLERP